MFMSSSEANIIRPPPVSWRGLLGMCVFGSCFGGGAETLVLEFFLMNGPWSSVAVLDRLIICVLLIFGTGLRNCGFFVCVLSCVLFMVFCRCSLYGMSWQIFVFLCCFWV